MLTAANRRWCVLLAGCWHSSVSGSGRSSCGSLRVWAGPTWRTGMDGCTPKPAICGWRYRLPSCSSSSVRSSRGQWCFYVPTVDGPECLQTQHSSYCIYWHVCGEELHENNPSIITPPCFPFFSSLSPPVCCSNQQWQNWTIEPFSSGSLRSLFAVATALMSTTAVQQLNSHY